MDKLAIAVLLECAGTKYKILFDVRNEKVSYYTWCEEQQDYAICKEIDNFLITASMEYFENIKDVSF